MMRRRLSIRYWVRGKREWYKWHRHLHAYTRALDGDGDGDGDDICASSVMTCKRNVRMRMHVCVRWRMDRTRCRC